MTAAAAAAHCAGRAATQQPHDQFRQQAGVGLSGATSVATVFVRVARMAVVLGGGAVAEQRFLQVVDVKVRQLEGTAEQRAKVRNVRDLPPRLEVQKIHWFVRVRVCVGAGVDSVRRRLWNGGGAAECVRSGRRKTN